MNKLSTVVMWAASIGLVFVCSPRISLAADKANYSGKYFGVKIKTALGREIDSTMEVLQTDDSIEITRVELGKTTTSRCPFNGTEGDYSVPGTCKAMLKAKYLVIENVALFGTQLNGPPVYIHTKQRWQLSAHGKTLTIKVDVDFPDLDRDTSDVLAASISGTRKYTRVGNP